MYLIPDLGGQFDPTKDGQGHKLFHKSMKYIPPALIYPRRDPETPCYFTWPFRLIP
jgi:hypothetical protein